MAHLLVRVGYFDNAEQTYAEARTTFEQAQGPSSLIDANIELHLGLLDLARGDFSDAEAHFVIARELFIPLVASDAPDLSVLELAEAKLAYMRGDFDRASVGLMRVLDTSVDDLRRAEAWEALGVIRFYQQDFVESLAAYERAKLYRQAALGPDNPRFGILYSNIGESLAASGDHQGALTAFADALAILKRTLPAEHADLAFPTRAVRSLGSRSAIRLRPLPISSALLCCTGPIRASRSSVRTWSSLLLGHSWTRESAHVHATSPRRLTDVS